MAQPTELFISEYIEGSGNNKAIELYNGAGKTINLATGGYVIQVHFNGAATPSLTINLTGSVANGDVFVLAQSSANAAILAQADQTEGSSWFNGDDAVVLRKGGANGTVIDVIGQVGFDPGSEWGSGLTSTQDNTLIRKSAVISGDADGANAFDPALEWNGFATDYFSDLGKHTIDVANDTPPFVSGTNPANGVVNVAANAPIEISFNEPVSVNGNWVQVTGSVSGQRTISGGGLAVSGGPRTFLIDPVADFTLGETVMVTVFAAQVQDQDGTPDRMVSDVSFNFFIVTSGCGGPAAKISTIQGENAASPLVSTFVTVEGVVTGDFQGSSKMQGFFIQEEDADQDGNPLTAEGIFVFDGAAPPTDVRIGDRVQVIGRVVEFNGRTELNNVNVAVCATGVPLPKPVEVSLPFPGTGGAEPYEGMRVTFPQVLTITKNDDLGRLGEVELSASGRQLQFTETNLPGNLAAYEKARLAERIILDDDRNGIGNTPVSHLQNNPTVRVGDAVKGLSGILDYSFNEYRIRPEGPVTFSPRNTRPAPPNLPGNLKIATFNLENFFNGQNGSFSGSRGASNASELAVQRSKLVRAILGLNADVLGVQELENDGYGASSAVQELVSALNVVAGAGTYAFINPGLSKLGDDEICVGLLYKPGVVGPVGPAAVLDNPAELFQGRNTSRAVLAQTFRLLSNNERFTIAVNHFKSKGGGSEATGQNADKGDGQSAWNAIRVATAQALVQWLATDPTGSKDPDFCIVGDLNAYAKEDPIRLLEQNGYVNLVTGEYSIEFQGYWGTFDYIFASRSFAAQFRQGLKWHINSDESPSVYGYSDGLSGYIKAEEPFGISDHDPVIAGFQLGSSANIKGTIKTEKKTGAKGVSVILSGDKQDTVQTDSTGNFSFSGLSLDKSYVLTPVYNQYFLDGVTTLDIILIARHILGSALLDSPFKIIAADVNRSGSVTVLDILQLRRLILGLDKTFPGNTSWRFVDAAFAFSEPGNPFSPAFPETIRIDKLPGDLEIGFVAVKVGDVNGSALDQK